MTVQSASRSRREAADNARKAVIQTKGVAMESSSSDGRFRSADVPQMFPGGGATAAGLFLTWDNAKVLV